LPISSPSNLSVCAAVNKNLGLIYYEYQHQSYDGDSFYMFLTNLSFYLQDIEMNNLCFVLDNCSIHCHEDLDYLTQKFNITLKFLPPYSPMLNPIEETFSELKQKIKTLFSTTKKDKIINIQRLPKGTKSLARRQILEEALIEAANDISHESISSYVNHMVSLIPKALGKMDL